MQRKMQGFLNLVVMGIVAIIMAAGPAGAQLYQYNYTFAYTDGGDTYSGYVVADNGYYQAGQTISDPTYQGAYEITSVGLYGGSYLQGYTTITSYTDTDTSQQNFTTSGSGSNYLGSESGSFSTGFPSMISYAISPQNHDADVGLAVYRYDYTFTYATGGDTYSGYILEPLDYYQVGQTISGGNLQGTYSITAASAYNELNPMIYVGGAVISSYTDTDTSQNTYTIIMPYSNTQKNLALESGSFTYNSTTYSFSPTGSDADVESATPQIYQYNFTFTYGNGDSYSGTVYAAPEHGYTTEYTQTVTDENGQTGTYTITAATGGYAASLAGQVYVDNYYDSESGYDYTPVSGSAAVGTNYLGSESDSIIMTGISEYLFGSSGGVFYEADRTTVAYDFTFTYSDGDIYTGTLYAAPEQGYYTGYTYDATGDNGLTGTYALTGATPGQDGTRGGQVFVNSYYDHESNSFLTPASANIALSVNYLGGEHDYVILGGVPEYLFGWVDDNLYEADLVAYAYDFTFTYGDGDYYTGTVYAAPEDGYTLGYSQTVTDENGQTGTYTITSFSTAIPSIASQQITGHIDADHDYAWDYSYDIGFGLAGDLNGPQLQVAIAIYLDGDDPGAALRDFWQDGIQQLWSDQYFITYGSESYPIEFTVEWASDPDAADQTVTVYNSSGWTNMGEWYMDSGWDDSWHAQISAHEYGHMLGLYDEYENGATHDGVTYSYALMADLGAVQERYYTGFLSWLQDQTGLSGLGLAAAAGADPAYDVSLAGQVYVNSYYDHESGNTYTPVSSGAAVGTGYLGSEADYIMLSGAPAFMFGYDAGSDTFREADYWIVNPDTGHEYTITWGDSWTGAQAAAAALGGNLATINDQAENDWLMSQFGAHEYWIGLYQTDTQAEPDGHWAWVGGEPATFVNWGGGEPNNQEGAENFGHAWDNGTWNDLENGYVLYGIVEKSAADPVASGLFDFTFTYGDGDSYTGQVYAPVNYGYYLGQTYNQTDENGNLGYYEITGVSYVAVPGYANGQVWVCSYYDHESGNTYTPVGGGAAVGAAYLGSEEDYIIMSDIPEFRFGNSGGVFYEADVGGYSRYDFRYYFNNGSGDYYLGYVYAPTSFQADFQFAVGTQIYYQPQSFWSQGYHSLGGAYYELTAITDGFAAAYDKQSYITAYYDADTAQASLGVNTNGSATAANIYVADRTADWEQGYAISGANYASFSPYVEADVILAAGSPVVSRPAPAPAPAAARSRAQWAAYWGRSAGLLEEENHR